MSVDADGTAVAIYQTVRETISAFDSILVTLLTQGNTFVIVILSIPAVANLHGIAAAGICMFSLILSLFFLLANLLYWSLLKQSVEVAHQLEKMELASIGKRFHITTLLNTIPLSAARGSFLLYLVLPFLLVAGSVILGTIYLLNVSPIWSGGFILVSLLVVVSAVAVYGVYLRRATADRDSRH